MLKVWVAEHLDMACEDYHLLGIFSTKKKAEKALEGHGYFAGRPYAIKIDEVYPET